MRTDQNTTCRWIRTIRNILQRYVSTQITFLLIIPVEEEDDHADQVQSACCQAKFGLIVRGWYFIWEKSNAGERGERRRCYAILLSRTSKCCGNYFPEMLSLIINQGAGQVYESVKHMAFKTQFSCRDSPCVSKTNNPAIQNTGLRLM